GLRRRRALATRGLAVTLLEARPRFGGRAASSVDRKTGETVDNCQHVAMGCCTNFLAFCERTGIADDFVAEDELTWIDGEGRAYRQAAHAGTAPLHLAGSFAAFGFLPLADRLRLPFVLRRLAADGTGDKADDPFDAWIAGRQSETAVARFWNPVLVSALSESLDRITLRYARQVFVEGFLRHRDAWRVYVPTKPFDALYRDGVVPALARHGCDVRAGAGVDAVTATDDRVDGVRLRDGSTLPADDVVLAVPAPRVADLLPSELSDALPLDRLAAIEHAPISSVHLVYDRPLTDLRHAVLLDRTSQWVFNHTAISGPNGPHQPCRVSGEEPNGETRVTGPPTQRQPQGHDGGSHAYQVVISASRAERDAGNAALIDEVSEELTTLWPVGANRLAGRVVTEPRAVFSVTPGIDRLRPPQATDVPGLTLAGDWTATGWPATMEGSVRSGYLAAEAVLARAGRPEHVVAPDLPASPLSRWLFP
ncbi:MAG: hydroxysqualene dehydroxylase HpnE, partial [Planctomycetota bacterium]